MLPLIPACAFGPVFASAWTTVGWVVLWIAAALVALLGLAVILPMHLRATGAVDDLNLDGQVRVRWAWGVISVRLNADHGATLHVLGLRCWTFRADDDEKKKKEKKDKPKKPRARGWLQWFLQYRHAGKRLLKRLIRTLRLQLQVQGELGLGDPASTALLNRFLWELNRASPSVNVQVDPDWLEERWQLDGELTARLWLAHLGLVLLAALFNREMRQMIRTVPRAGR